MSSFVTEIRANDLPQGVEPPVNPAESKKLWAAAKALEATFTKFLLSAANQKLPGTDSATPGAGIYSDMFNTAISEKLAETGTVGLAKEIYIDVDKIQRRTEASHTSSPNGEKS